MKPNFDSRALTEIGFRRDGVVSIPADEFETEYERIAGQELVATAAGPVKEDAERAMLASLEAQVEAVQSGLGEDSVVVVESQQRTDHPRTRERVRAPAEGRKMQFEWTVDPPLRIGVYRRK